MPKGRVDPRESPRSAAARETREEAGDLRVDVVRKIASRRSSSALRHYYLMTASPAQVKRLKARRRKLARRPKRRRYLDDHKETLDARWVSLRKAEKLLQRGRDRKVLEAARRALGAFERAGGAAR